MKLTDLFEVDPRLGGALQKAASGIGQAAQDLKGPLPLSRARQEAENMRDEFNKYAGNNADKMSGVEIFTSFVANRKKKKPRDNLEIDKTTLVNDEGKFNARVLRSIFMDIAKAEMQYAKDNTPDTTVKRRGRDNLYSKGKRIPDKSNV